DDRDDAEDPGDAGLRERAPQADRDEDVDDEHRETARDAERREDRGEDRGAPEVAVGSRDRTGALRRDECAHGLPGIPRRTGAPQVGWRRFARPARARPEAR